MKKVNLIISALCLTALTSCKIGGLEMQKDFEYKSGNELHPEINKSAKQYLLDRGKNPVIANDTVFKYMQLGLEYAGIDLAEYEKPGRTFIFLSNNSIRVINATSKLVTSGFWFDFPIMDKNPDGSQKFAADGVTPVTHIAKSWNEYSQATVRNYFLYLIGQGDLGFNNAVFANTSLTSILPAGTVASKESKIGYLVSSTTPNFNTSGARIITYNFGTAGGAGFDPESKFNLKINTGDFGALAVNNNANVATGGLVATNGQIHVCAVTVYPCRY